MKTRMPYLLVLGIVAIAASARADTPRINAVDPPAVERGVASSIQIVGAGLAGTSEIYVPFPAEVRKESSSSDQVRFSITPTKETPPGVYPLRVLSPEGISNLRLINITSAPVVRAKEPNGRYKNGRLDLEQAQRVEWPVVIAGGRLERDIDLYRFSVEAGQRLTLVTETRRLGLTPDPIMRLRDAQGKILAAAHDTPGLARDERIDYTFEKAGEYFLELQSFGVSGWNNHYVVKIGPWDYARALFPLGARRGEKTQFQIVGRDGSTSTVEAQAPRESDINAWRLPLTDYPGSLPWNLAIGDLPEVTENNALNTAGEPTLLPWPVTVNGRISRPGEEDLYRIAVVPGEHIRVRVEAYHLGSTLDGYLMIYDPVEKKLLASNDDEAYRGNPDPDLSFEVPKDFKGREVVICLRDTLNGGGEDHGYRLTVERGGPDFYLWLGKAQDGTRSNEENESWFRMDANDTLNLPVGKEVKFRVSVRRDAKQNDPHYRGAIQGFQGPIHLKAEQMPQGVTIQPTIIPEGKLEGELVCLATTAAPLRPFEILIIGEGTRSDGSKIRRIAERKLFTADPQMFNLPWNWRSQKLTCVVTRPTTSIAAKP